MNARRSDARSVSGLGRGGFGDSNVNLVFDFAATYKQKPESTKE
jgi:hypothetical protein